MNALLLLVLVAAPASAKVDFSDNSQKRNAVQKVVSLLNEMSAQIEKEAADDAEMYDKMACWCETNVKEKTKAVADAQARISDLNAAVPEYAAKGAQLEVDIKQLGKDVVTATGALDEATGIREKEHAEFLLSEKDMISNIASLKSAVNVMSKVAAGAALNQESMKQIQGLLRHNMEHHRVLLQGLTSTQHKTMFSFLQSEPAAMLQQTRGKRAAAKAPSSAIFGILKSMKEQFETSLGEAQEEEKLGAEQFADLKKAKTAEIAANKDLVETKTVQLAEAKEKKATSKEDLEDTRVQLSADNKFLSDVSLKCDSADKDYADRVKVRNEELKAVSETIAILTDDDAKDQFNKSGMGTFIQLSMRTVRKSAKELAMKRLVKASKDLKKPELATLAMEMRLSGFEKVKESIDKMHAALKAEQAEEVKQKDYCTGELMENEKNVAEKMDLKGDLEAKINDLTTQIADLTDAIAGLSAEVAETQKEMMKASQIREAANKEFQTCVEDQRATQAILKKAVDKLKSFYGFVQTKQAPEQGTYEKSKGASGIITMIETLVEESKTLEAEATKGEAAAQADYESFMKDSTSSISALQKDIANKSEDKAKAEANSVMSSDDLKATISDLLTLGEYGQEVHKKCDFLLKNFDLRQSSRTQEMEALAQAKAIFSGAK
jgi:uncharacterized coiled-coil protein SlyX